MLDLPKLNWTISELTGEWEADWSWRPRLRDLNPPVYVYSWQECVRWDMHHVRGMQMPALQPWSFPAYRGPAARPARIGVTR